ncbi:MAG: hypothetical protein J0M05_00020 [Candidatus Kapabacteria bacterium]|nr:hypothetical protein [Candidatus Kapabacteria bacterium]
MADLLFMHIKEPDDNNTTIHIPLIMGYLYNQEASIRSHANELIISIVSYSDFEIGAFSIVSIT